MADILSKAPKPQQIAKLIAQNKPDILVLSGLDHDHGLAALTALRDLMTEHGHDFAHIFAFPSNAGVPSGHDLNADGRSNTADDAHGYGNFRGEKALALLSRHPVIADQARDFSHFLWQDLPEARLPFSQNAPIAAHHRLSSTGHWDVPVQIGAQWLHLLIYQAGPPVFGGPTDRNLWRNHDETQFWVAYLNGKLPMPPPDAPVVIMGGSNLDPHDGDGLQEAMRHLLAHPRLQDPQPASDGAVIAAAAEHSHPHLGPHALDTVEWPQRPGNLRVSYILPDASLTVTNAGVFWPAPDQTDAALLGTPDSAPSRHRLVWVDIKLP